MVKAKFFKASTDTHQRLKTVSGVSKKKKYEREKNKKREKLPFPVDLSH